MIGGNLHAILNRDQGQAGDTGTEGNAIKVRTPGNGSASSLRCHVTLRYPGIINRDIL